MLSQEVQSKNGVIADISDPDTILIGNVKRPAVRNSLPSAWRNLRSAPSSVGLFTGSVLLNNWVETKLSVAPVSIRKLTAMPISLPRMYRPNSLEDAGRNPTPGFTTGAPSVELLFDSINVCKGAWLVCVCDEVAGTCDVSTCTGGGAVCTGGWAVCTGGWAACTNGGAACTGG